MVIDKLEDIKHELIKIRTIMDYDNVKSKQLLTNLIKLLKEDLNSEDHAHHTNCPLNSEEIEK